MSPEVRTFVEEAASGLKRQWDKLEAKRLAPIRKYHKTLNVKKLV